MLNNLFKKKSKILNLGFLILVAPTSAAIALAAGCTGDGLTYEEEVTSITQLKSVADNAFSDEVLTDASWTDATSSVRKAGITRNNMLSVGKKAFLNAQFTKLDLPNLVYVGQDAFSANTKLTSIRLPNAREVYHGSFADSPLTEVYLPRARTAPSLTKAVNDKSTVVTLPSLWNNPTLLSFLFTSPSDLSVVAHDKITFVWVDETKEALGDIEGGFNFTFVTGTYFRYEPLSDSDWDAPNGKLAKANFPRNSVVAIDFGEFRDIGFTKLFLPVVTSIESRAFGNNLALTNINFPHLNRLGEYSFSQSPLTEIYAPKLFEIGSQSFSSVVNASTTKITLPVVHNSPVALDNMFLQKSDASGVLAYDKITFIWVDDNGNDLTDVKTNLTPLPNVPLAN